MKNKFIIILSILFLVSFVSAKIQIDVADYPTSEVVNGSYLAKDGSNADQDVNLGLFDIYATNGFFNNIYSSSYIDSNYFNKTTTNSTGLIGLECLNGEILEFNSGVWECGTDGTGTDDQNLYEVLVQGNNAGELSIKNISQINFTGVRNITFDGKGNLELDGDGDYVEIGDYSDYDLNYPFTLITWVNLSKDDILAKAIVSKWWDGATRGYMWYLRGDGAGSFQQRLLFRESGNPSDTILEDSTTFDFNLSEWNLASMQYNGSHYRLAINNVADLGWQEAGEISPNNAVMRIGEQSHVTSSPINEFGGSMDEIMLFDRSLSSSEISNIYDLNRSDYNQSNNDGYLKLDGAGDYVDLGDDVIGGFGEFTISFWTKINSHVTNTCFTCAWGVGDTRRLLVRENNLGDLSFFTYTSGQAGGDTTINLPLDTWTHITLVYNSTHTYAYENGVYAAGSLKTQTGAINDIDPFNLYLGNDNGASGTFLNGDMDEVMFFNTALTGSEITNIYNLDRSEYNGSTANLVSYYQFKGEKNNFSDSQGLNNGTGFDGATTTGLLSYWQFDGTPNDFTDTLGNYDGTGFGNAKTVIENGTTLTVEDWGVIKKQDGDLFFDTKDGVGYFSGQVSATGYITRTYETKKTDKEAYNLFLNAKEKFKPSKKNYWEWGECAIKGEGSTSYLELVDTCQEKSEDGESCTRWDKKLVNITRNNYLGVDIECKQVITQKAFNWQTGQMTRYGNLTDFDTGIMAENIYTQSKTIKDNVSYIEKVNDKGKLKTKETHHAYIENIMGTEYDVLDMEERVVVLEGAVNELFTILCEKNFLKKEDGCLT